MSIGAKINCKLSIPKWPETSENRETKYATQLKKIVQPQSAYTLGNRSICLGLVWVLLRDHLLIGWVRLHVSVYVCVYSLSALLPSTLVCTHIRRNYVICFSLFPLHFIWSVSIFTIGHYFYAFVCAIVFKIYSIFIPIYSFGMVWPLMWMVHALVFGIFPTFFNAQCTFTFSNIMKFRKEKK